MNRETASLIGVLASAFLLLWTAHPPWFLACAAFGFYYGWNVGKRYIPAEDYA